MDKHESAIRHHEEMLFLHKHYEKHMNGREQKSFWKVVRNEINNDIKMHELYIVVKDRVERLGGK